jgi:hypothetical protein
MRLSTCRNGSTGDKQKRQQYPRLHLLVSFGLKDEGRTRLGTAGFLHLSSKRFNRNPNLGPLPAKHDIDIHSRLFK